MYFYQQQRFLFLLCLQIMKLDQLLCYHLRWYLHLMHYDQEQYFLFQFFVCLYVWSSGMHVFKRILPSEKSSLLRGCKDAKEEEKEFEQTSMQLSDNQVVTDEINSNDSPFYYWLDIYDQF